MPVRSVVQTYRTQHLSPRLTLISLTNYTLPPVPLSPINHPYLLTSLLLANVLVPVLGTLGNELGHQVLALLVVHVDQLSALVLQPLLTPHEGLVLPHDNPLDAVQQTGTSAHRAGRQGGVHGTVLVGLAGKTTGVLQAQGLPVQGGRALLNALVVATTQNGTVLGNQRSTDGDTTLGVTLSRLLERNLQTLLIVERHCVVWRELFALQAMRIGTGSAAVCGLGYRRSEQRHARNIQGRRWDGDLHYLDLAEVWLFLAWAAQADDVRVQTQAIVGPIGDRVGVSRD